MDGLQKALYGVLTTTTAITDDLSTAWGQTAVFDHVPQENAEDAAYYPFISIGAETITPWDSKTSDGYNAVVQIDIWTRDGGSLSNKRIAGAVHDALHFQPLTIAGSTHVLTRVESAVFTKDPDGHTRHGIMLVRVLQDEV